MSINISNVQLSKLVQSKKEVVGLNRPEGMSYPSICI